ncbi:MAG: hypothetical protein LBT09_10945 [Planctomycetaceae bacterium]|nr:hypothetical protein [Planctomycetaceae bacterium]
MGENIFIETHNRASQHKSAPQLNRYKIFYDNSAWQPASLYCLGKITLNRYKISLQCCEQ